MAYLKLQGMKKFIPVPRKGKAYVARSSHNQSNSVPVIIAIRDILGFVKTKKELKKIINEKGISVNGKEIRETNYPLGLFDILTLNKIGKSYRVVLNEHKKLELEEVSGKDADKKTLKIIGKKVLGKDKVQLNFRDGWNVIVKENPAVGDSVVYNFKDKKIEKMVKMEKGKQGFIVEGKHAGVNGDIEEVVERGGKMLARIKTKDEKINVWVKNVIVMEK